MDEENKKLLASLLESPFQETYARKWVKHKIQAGENINPGLTKAPHPYLITRDVTKERGLRPLYPAMLRSSEKDADDRNHNEFPHKPHTELYEDCRKKQCFLNMQGRIIARAEFTVTPYDDEEVCEEPEYEKLMQELFKWYQ